MSFTLSVINDGCFGISSVPYAKSLVLPKFNIADGKLTFFYTPYKDTPLFPQAHYSDITNAATGLPFASMSELIEWVQLNCFVLPAGSTPGSTVALMKVLYVKTVPAADDEVAPGAAIVHEFLDTGTLQKIEIAGTDYYTDSFTHTPGTGTGTVSFDDDTEFVNNDVVFLLKNP